MKVLAIIVTFNPFKWIDRCVGSLLSSLQKVDILVVDNGSTDGSIEHIRAAYPSVRLIQNSQNIGFGAANNIGFKIALKEDYDFVYLINQDAWVEPDTIRELINASTEKFAILSPLQLASDGTFDKNFEHHCSKNLRRALPESFSKADFANLSPNSESPSLKTIGPIEVPFVMAAHWLLRSETIRKIGGFSPAFSQYGEDDNYIDRLHYFGYQAGVLASARAVHDRGERKEDPQKRIHLKCTASLVRLSDPGCSFIISAIIEPLRLVATAVKNLSFYPIRFIPILISRYSELSELRRKSFEKQAFIEL